MKPKVKVFHERTVYTHSELYYAAEALLDEAKESKARYLLLYSLVGCAFSLEAYLNFLGDKLFKFWDQVDRIPVHHKLTLLLKHMGLTADYSVRPYQTLQQLWRFRNFMAHARPEYGSHVKEYDATRPIPRDYPQMEWERYCTVPNAQRAFDDVKTIINQLHSESGVQEGHLGIYGTHGGKILKDA